MKHYWRYSHTPATLTILLFTQTLTFHQASSAWLPGPTVRSSSRPLTKALNEILRLILHYWEKAPTKTLKTSFSEGFAALGGEIVVASP